MAGIDKKTLAAAKSYTDKSIQGGGAVAGKNCTIESITPITGGNRATYKWYLDDGTEQTDTMDVMNGQDGQDGAPGQNGTNGHDGSAATIQVGTVTSGAAPAVNNAGTSSAAVFDFVLPKGDKGDKGDTGADGKSFEIKAQYSTYADLIAAHPTGQAGDAYFVGDDTSPDLYVWLVDDNEWFNNGPIAGIKGDKGDDGFSPVANATKSGDTVTITITDKNGTTTKTVKDGADGAQGPAGADGDDGNGIASIEKTSTAGLVDTYTVTFTNGTTTTFTVTNGAQGAPGQNGQNGTDGTDGNGITKIEKTGTSGKVDTYTISFTNGGTSTFTVTNGNDGQNGQNGSDGVGISSIEKTSTSGLVDTYTITFTNSLTTTFTVTNGADGAQGPAGADGDDGNGITSVEKTGASGLVDTYTITFTDATTSTFTVTNGKDGDDGEGVPTGGTAGQFLAKKSGTNYDTEWKGADDILDIITPKNAGARNSVYRGKYLGNAVTAAQYAAISAGTFEGLFIGDYWTIGGVDYEIADFDYWMRTGDTECTTHHVAVVPKANMYTAKMNDSNVTTGGYTGSKMYTANLADAKTAINTAFGSAHILSHRELFTNAMASDKASGWAWYDSTVDLMNECMVYGHCAWASHPGYETGIDKSQLSLFRLRPERITNRATWWLRDVVSSASFAYVSSLGRANGNSASNAFGVRPAFAIKA